MDIDSTARDRAFVRDRAYPRTAHGGTTGDERMNKFTEGPWTEKGWAITGPAAAAAKAAEQGIEEFAKMLGRKALCVTVAQAKPGHRAVAVVLGAAQAEVDANARLIAAAPDLLVACQTFAEWLRREEAGGTNEPWAGKRDTLEGEAAWREWYDENLRICDLAQEQARAAIAKATGKAP